MIFDMVMVWQSKECLERVTQTVSFLASPVDSLLLLLTGTMTSVFSSRFWRFC